MGAGPNIKPQYSGGPEGAFNNPWGDINASNLAQAQQFADQGQWDQAAQQYQLGGGQGFTQPQYQAFTQQYGNVGSPAGQLGGVFGQPGGPYKWTDGPGSGMWGPPDQPQPIGEYVSDDYWGPPAQAQPIAPPAQAQPAPPPSFVPRPPPQMSAPQNPNWASYVQGNPDLIKAYNQGSPQSIGDWGKSHWESFGQNEGRSVNPYSGLLA